MRRLLACTCLTPLAVAALGGALHAETQITTKVTTPVTTATAANGQPDSIRITATGGISPTAPGAAVTVNSSHNVTSEGSISYTGISNATGILINPGFTSNVTNSGTIALVEDFTATDTDNDGDLDGAFAQGSNRFGIRLAPGGTLTGNIITTGEIAIEGNQSAAIALDGRLAGALYTGSTINVVGNDSAAIRAQDVTGAVIVNGVIGVRGGNSVGIDLRGNVGGQLTLQGGLTATGYRSVVAPADQSKLDADDLLQSGPALRVAGDVAGGIILAVRPADTNPNDSDEDDDGVVDTAEGNAAVTTYGAAPAIQIGAADRTVTVGALAGQANGHGLVIDGTVSGLGIYNGINANGIAIGGLGQAVTIAGGMTVNGTVRAESAGGAATAIRIGNGATVNEMRIGGTVSASAGNGANAAARAILIDAQGTTTTIRNSGAITALASAEGSAGAIVDNSGRVSLIETSGRISATGATAASGRNVAIDLRANTIGATVRQTQVGQGVTPPQIAGDILFGAGNDLLDVADGSVTGAVRFGAGEGRLNLSGDAVLTGAVEFGASVDRLSLAGTSVLNGSVNFGGGADLLELNGTSRLTGALANSAGVAATINGGLLDATNQGTVQLTSLAVTGSGGIGVTIDGQAGTHTSYRVLGAASFAAGSQVRVTLANISAAAGTYTILDAASLTGASNLSFNSANLPFLFTGSLASTGNQVSVTIARKSAAQLGLSGSQGRAYDAIFAALDSDQGVSGTFLAINDAAALQATVQQMLPEHAGGAFDTVTMGSRATTRILDDPRAPFADRGRWGFWIQQIAWGSSKGLGDTASYDITGWGAAGGAEIITNGVGSFGLSLAYLTGEDADGDTDNQVRADQFELGAYWRGQWGGLRAHARASAARIDFDGTRFFTGQAGGQTVTRTAAGSWNGQLYSAMAGLSYEHRIGRINLRPAASIDYYRLSEDGYSETGGGDAFNLIVDERNSDELAGQLTLAAGYNFGRMAEGATWLRAEIEGGRRQILGGELGATTAQFANGTPFTLLPEQRTDGWLGRLRLIGGNPGFTVGGEASAEEQFGRTALGFRVSVQIGM